MFREGCLRAVLQQYKKVIGRVANIAWRKRELSQDYSSSDAYDVCKYTGCFFVHNNFSWQEKALTYATPCGGHVSFHACPVVDDRFSVAVEGASIVVGNVVDERYTVQLHAASSVPAVHLAQNSQGGRTTTTRRAQTFGEFRLATPTSSKNNKEQKIPTALASTIA